MSGGDDERPERLPEIVEFYERGLEDARLTDGDGSLEFQRTCSILEPRLPAAPARILDVGGGPGRYAAWLAQRGYEVTLVDPVPLHVAQAKERSSGQSGHPFEARLGDARALEYADGSFDAVLMLGPLYHLPEIEDRQRAWHEALRIVRPGGPVAAACISRFASLLDGGMRGWLASKPDFRAAAFEDARSGRHHAVDDESFTWAYFHDPDEFRAEAVEAGLVDVELLAVEGVWWLLHDLSARHQDPGHWQSLLDALSVMEAEPSLLGASPHILAVGRRPV